MATYEALMKGSKAGVVLFPGDPVSSPLVAAVESGQMPPSGNRVPKEELDKLKAWVAQGAKFDGADLKANLKDLANGSSTAPRNEPAIVEIKPATGKETVSFSNDIAPILVSNCNGCHYQGNNAPGGLRLNTFSEVLKGGDSGPIVLPGNPNESLLVQKLLGMSGQRMPAGGRPPLSEPQIEAIKTWIREGATFDGDSRDSRLDAVIAKYWTAKANHQELMERRMERAREKWQVVAPKSIPDEASDQDVHVVGNIGPAASETLLSLANQVAKTLRKQYRLGAKAPIVKGGITIFALKSRYDYSELGKMLEKRELPASWSAHWRKETPDLYIAMVYDSSDPKINESTLIQQMTSAWVASVDGTPRWFADGVGRNALANAVGVNDIRVQPWSRRFPDILAELKDVQPVLEGKINDEDLAIVGFGTIRRWMGTPLRPKFELLLRQLASAESFDETFSQILGPADLFLKQMLGKP
jgi:mono/diheme cytochrome c family protein